jgi:hypothetical protein
VSYFWAFGSPFFLFKDMVKYFFIAVTYKSKSSALSKIYILAKVSQKIFLRKTILKRYYCFWLIWYKYYRVSWINKASVVSEFFKSM